MFKYNKPEPIAICKRFGFEVDGAVVLNGFQKINLIRTTFTHIFLSYQIGTLVFSKKII